MDTEKMAPDMKPLTGTATFTLNLPVQFRAEAGLVVAEFPSLNVASQGRTRDEATQNLIEAAQLFIESCLGRNRLDDALKELGFVPGHFEAAESIEHLQVPVEFMVLRNGSPTHAC